MSRYWSELAVAIIGGGVVLIDTGVIKGGELISIISFGAVLVAAAKTTDHAPKAASDARRVGRRV